MKECIKASWKNLRSYKLRQSTCREGTGFASFRVMAMEMVRLAALADIHFSKSASGTLQPLLGEVARSADVLLLAGDLTNDGLPEEAQLLARELMTSKIPIVAVLGNHDYHGDKPAEVRGILADAGITVLDGEACEVCGIGIAGVKGFAGGFDERLLAAWGEAVVKQFVHESISEALKLESALAKLRTTQRIALLHYAPIRGTVEGEPLEIFPFLGSSRLEEPLNRYGVTAVFHGHAHHGSFTGKTHGGIPVYNVAMSLLRQTFPDRPPFHVITVSAGAPPDAATQHQIVLPG
jgi:Icc-related predicted phosphoesterase